MVDNFVDHLLLNVNITKKKGVYNRKKKTMIKSINMGEDKGGIVEHYNYLGVLLNNRMS